VGRREDNKRQKRAALERAGLLTFRAVGYEAASIEQIARDAEVARGTFYLYFPTKIALFDALADTWTTPVEVVLDAAGAALAGARDQQDVLLVYRRMAEALAGVVLLHREAIEVAFRESRQPGEAGRSLRARELRLLSRVDRLTAEASARGLIEVGDARLFGLVVYGAVERLAWEVLQGSSLGPPGEVADAVSGWFAAALRVRGGALSPR
jgi:AcrR family transcriptional regulator